MSNIIEVKVPDIGDVAEVDVIEVLVAQGDTVSKEQSLITVESDKASMEIPSTAAGVVKSLKVSVGDKVGEGTLILELEAEGAAKPAKQPKAPAAEATKPESAPAAASAPAATAPAAASARSEQVTVVVPDIGDATDVEVIEVMVAVGDQVEAEQGLITVESDKASIEVPSSHSGVVKEVRVKLGDKVNQGNDIVILEVAAASGSEVGAEAPQADVAPAPVEALREPDIAPESNT